MMNEILCEIKENIQDAIDILSSMDADQDEELRDFEQYLERTYWDFISWERLLWNKFGEE